MSKVSTSARETPAEGRYRKVFAERRERESLTALAVRNGIVPGTLFWWRSELRRRDGARAEGQDAAPRLLPVHVIDAPAHSAPVAGLIYEIALADGRRVLRVPAGFELEAVRALVAAVEGASC